MFPIATNFPMFYGLDGDVLDGGYVYIGQPNQNPVTAPMAVYWDAAGTQPAAQPLRTKAGYIVRAGTPAPVFFASDYSTLVNTRRGERVYYTATSSALGPRVVLLDGSQAMTGILRAFGGGIQFPATQIPSADPNTLDDYETHGSWTPVDASGAGIPYSSALGLYIKDGNRVWIGGGVTYPVNAGGGALAIGGLPFPAISGFAQAGGAWINGYSSPTMGVLDSGVANLKVRNLATGANVISSAAGGLSVSFNLLYLTTN